MALRLITPATSPILPAPAALRYVRFALPVAAAAGNWPRSIPRPARRVLADLAGRLAFYDFALGRIRGALDRAAAERGIVREPWAFGLADRGAAGPALSLLWHDPGVFGWPATVRMIDLRAIFAPDHYEGEEVAPCPGR